MKSYIIALSTLLFAVLPRSAEALEIQDDCCILRERFLLADVGLHVVNIGWATTLGNEQRSVFEASIGLYGAWTQTRNLFGVSGDAANIKATGGNLRLRYIWYRARQQKGLWLAPFVQVGGAQIRDDKAARDGAHLGSGWLRLVDRRFVASRPGCRRTVSRRYWVTRVRSAVSALRYSRQLSAVK
jgi:hypothetical protein